MKKEASKREKKIYSSQFHSLWLRLYSTKRLILTYSILKLFFEKKKEF